MTVWTQNVESMVENHIPIARSNIIYWDHCSLRKTNRSAPENRTSQEEIHLPTIHVQVRTGSLREGNPVDGSEIRRENHLGCLFFTHRK